MKLILVILVAVLSVGCSAPTVMVNVSNLDKSSSLLVDDLRPESEKENKIFSLSISSDAYGTYRRGDKLTNPNSVRLFQHKVYEKYADGGILPDVKVHHFVVYMNFKSELRRGVAGGLLGGAIGTAIASRTKKYGIDGIARLTTEEKFNSFEKEYQRALYSKEENPDKVSVYRVYLDASIDGKRTFVTTMTQARLPKELEKTPHAAAIETAISYFLDQY